MFRKRDRIIIPECHQVILNHGISPPGLRLIHDRYCIQGSGHNAFLHTGLYMRLRKLKLTNFRGYRNSTEINFDEGMTGIVGRNDFGKSTLPEALAIFFETEGIKSGKNIAGAYIAPHNTGTGDKI